MLIIAFFIITQYSTENIITARKRGPDLDKKPFLKKAVFRFILFFTLFLAASLLFYFIGNYQQFLDKDQKLILNICTITSILLMLFALAGIVITGADIIVNRKEKYLWKRLLFLLLMISAFACGTVIMLFTRIITVLSAGI